MIDRFLYQWIVCLVLNETNPQKQIIHQERTGTFLKTRDGVAAITCKACPSGGEDM